MLPESYITALENFTIEEVKLIRQYNGEEIANKKEKYYSKLYNYVSSHVNDFITLDESKVNFIELEFIERVEKLRDKLTAFASLNNIPLEVLFIPQIKITGLIKRKSIINLDVAEFIRELYDNDLDEELQTLRHYKIIERKSLVSHWLKSKNGKNFLYEFQVSKGIRADILIKKQLHLFDKKFLYVQMQCMSTKIWIHNEVIEAYSKWESDNTLWKSINHLKRKIIKREIYDESRLEIKFLRLLENHGFINRYIHDTHISWQIKFRPDFWFINENLIVEYDEKAHKFQIEDDIRREKIIRKYIPNVTFIRVSEGFEEDGIIKIKAYLNNFENKYLT